MPQDHQYTGLCANWYEHQRTCHSNLSHFVFLTIPQLLPGIIAAALLAFTLSFDDFVITFFVAGVGSTTLPLKIYSMVRLGVSPKINALSAMIVIFSIILISIADRLQRKSV